MLSTYLGNWKKSVKKETNFWDPPIIIIREFSGSSNPSQKFILLITKSLLRSRQDSTFGLKGILWYLLTVINFVI